MHIVEAQTGNHYTDLIACDDVWAMVLRLRLFL
jgi:hypothetical protein